MGSSSVLRKTPKCDRCLWRAYPLLLQTAPVSQAPPVAAPKAAARRSDTAALCDVGVERRRCHGSGRGGTAPGLETAPWRRDGAVDAAGRLRWGKSMEEKLVTIDQIAQARERLPSAVVHTPMLLSEELGHRIHKRVYLKCENL